jgi:hypothetical protein
MGARGLRGIRSFLGSISRRVGQDAHRPVLVTPAAEVKVKETSGETPIAASLPAAGE